MREAVLDIENAVMERHVQVDVQVELVAQVAQKRVVLVMRKRVPVLMDVPAGEWSAERQRMRRDGTDRGTGT